MLNLRKITGLAAAALMASVVSAQAVVLDSSTANPGAYAFVTPANSLDLPTGGTWAAGATPSTQAGNSSGIFRSPYDETADGSVFSTTAPGASAANQYWAVGPNNPDNPSRLEFTSTQKRFSFLWGSPDSFNTLIFRLNGSDVGSFSSGDVAPPVTFGSTFVRFSGLFDEVEFSATSNAFEFLGVDATEVPLPAAAWLLLAGLGGMGLVARRRKAA